MGVLGAVQHIINENAMQARISASNHLAKAVRASHGPRVSLQSQAKERVKRTNENTMESPKEPKVRSKVPKAHTTVKHRKMVYQVWKARNHRQARNLRKMHKHVPLTIHGFLMDGVLTNGMTAGVWMNGTMTEVVLDGMKIVNKHMTHLQAHFHWKAQNGQR